MYKNVLCAQSACVSVLLSHTVLSEPYQGKLQTEDEVMKMTGQEEKWAKKVVRTQCTSQSEAVTTTADVLRRSGFSMEARQLRGW